MRMAEPLTMNRIQMQISDRRLGIENNYALYIRGRFIGEYVSVVALELREGMLPFGTNSEVHALNDKPEVLEYVYARIPY